MKDFEGIPVAFSYEIHTSPLSQAGALVAAVYGVDVQEMGDGYTATELRQIAEGLKDLATLLDLRNAERNTPLLDSHIQVSDQSLS